MMHNFTTAQEISCHGVTKITTITDFSNSRSSRNGLPKYKIGNVSLKNTNVTTSTTNSIAIVGNDRGQIGMACMDLRCSELNLCQFVDTSSYTLLKVCLSIHEPVEVILPEVLAETSGTGSGEILTDFIRNLCGAKSVTSIQRRFFNDSRGIELVKQLGVQECSNVDASVLRKYSCMAAAAALIKYVECIQSILFAQNSLKITYSTVEDSCLIDVSSWKNLDLIHLDKSHVKGEYNSLFEILNCCITPGGKRVLRSFLLQPSTDPAVINYRLDVVEELKNNDAMLGRMRTVLSSLRDLQQLMIMCVHIKQHENVTREDSKKTIRNKIAHVIQLKGLLKAMTSLCSILKHSKSPFFIETVDRLADKRLAEISVLVDCKLDSSHLENKRKGTANLKDAVLYAVCEGQHVLLDLARRAYQELLAEIMQIGVLEQQKLPTVQMSYTYNRGYHLTLSAADPFSVQLPSNYIQVVRNRASITFTTRNLIKYNDRLVQSENEILLKSNMVLDQLIISIRELLPALYNCVEYISLIDFFSSMAVYAGKVNSVRPVFGNQLLVRQGRHPILDYSQEVVPNDTYIVPDVRFAVIAGPNMAGKSTYMRQVCLLQIMAQCGIFSRIGHNDDLSRNLSGFAVEMSEMAVIHANANEKTLIIIDELARSTSTEEGIGMCYAICEELIALKSFVLFATHYLDLSLMELNFPAVVNYHFTADTKLDDDGEECLVPNHVLFKGTYNGPLYGLELAKLTTLPKSILENAQEMAHRLRANVEKQHRSSEVLEAIKRKKLGYLAHRIMHVLSLRSEPQKMEAIRLYLNQLQKKVKNNELV